MAEQAVIQYLLADIPVAAVVGTRVYPVAYPQGSALPVVTVTRVSGGPVYADDGEAGVFMARLQVDSFGLTYAAAKDLSVLIKARLSAVRDVAQSGITFRHTFLDTEQDMRETGSEEFEYEYRVRQDYIIWYA